MSVHLPEAVLALGALLAAVARGRLGAAALVLAPALALVALGPDRAAPRALEAALLGGLLAAAVVAHEAGAPARAHAPLLLASAGLLLLGGAGRVEVAALALVLALAPTALMVRRADPATGDRFAAAALLCGGLAVAGLGLLAGVSAGPGLDVFALPADAHAPGPKVLLAVTLVAFCLTPLLGAAPFGAAWSAVLPRGPLAGWPPALGLWLATCAPIAAAALLARLLSSLRAPGGGLLVADVEPGAVVGAFGVLAIAGARLATRHEADLGRLLAGQAAAGGGWLLVALGALGARGPLDPRPALAAVALLALTAVVGHAAGAALLATADRELGGRGLERWLGAARRNRWLALALVLTVASLAGAPGTLGFVARLHAVVGALEGGQGVIALLAALDVALGLVLTLRVARVALLARPPRPAFGPDAVEPLVTTPGLTVLAVALGALSLGLGLFPAALVAALR
ncbi:MAG: hypothetical protein M9894_14185 [Planctomycetes bacterium]|nr:hypothetical protein [Planctomycetota bacterium]